MIEQGTKAERDGQISAQAPSTALRMAFFLMMGVVAFTALVVAAFVAVSRGNLAQHASAAIIIGGMVYALVVILLVIPTVVKVARLELGDEGYFITPEYLLISERRLVRHWPWFALTIRAVPLRDIQGVYPEDDFLDRTFGYGMVHVDTSNGEMVKVGPIRNHTEFAERLLHEILVTSDYSVEDY